MSPGILSFDFIKLTNFILFNYRLARLDAPMYITTNVYYNQCILQPMYIAHLPPTSTGQGSGLGFTSYIQFKPIINF